MQNTPERGSFLIANPRLHDPNFARTVVLICEYNEGGAFGLIVNRTSSVSISEVLHDDAHAAEKKDKVFTGGPVQKNHLLYLHSDYSLTNNGSKEICKGAYLGGDANYLRGLLLNKSKEDISLRLYMGSSGWGAGQLDEELKINSWIVCPANESFIFHPKPDKVWREVLYSMGGQYALLSTYPSDPILN